MNGRHDYHDARYMMLSSVDGGGDCASQELEDGACAIFTFPSTRRKPLPFTFSKHSEQSSHRICAANRTLLIRIRVEERRQRYDYVRCNQ